MASENLMDKTPMVSMDNQKDVFFTYDRGYPLIGFIDERVRAIDRQKLFGKGLSAGRPETSS
jgi:hypothetical protein